MGFTVLSRVSGAEIGMLVVETIAKIRRAYFVQGKPIKQICRELKLSRKVVRKVLRSEETAFEYKRSVQPQPKLGAWREELDRLLAANAARSSRERVTLLRIYEDLRGLGYEGGYDAVRRYAAAWRRRASTGTGAAFVPLSFDPGEAYQFDWSHERDRAGRRRHGDDQGRSHAALPQPDAVRSGLSARDPGDGVRRA
jgi:hypothetical protein